MKMLGVGLKCVVISIGAPLLMPPKIPPALLLAKLARILPPLVRIEFLLARMKSLFSLPFSVLALTPAPICTAFTPFMPISAPASAASSLPYSGSPSPAGTPVTRVSTQPPILSPAFLTLRINSFCAPSTAGSIAKISLFCAKSKSKFSA